MSSFDVLGLDTLDFCLYNRPNGVWYQILKLYKKKYIKPFFVTRKWLSNSRRNNPQKETAHWRLWYETKTKEIVRDHMHEREGRMYTHKLACTRGWASLSVTERARRKQSDRETKPRKHKVNVFCYNTNCTHARVDPKNERRIRSSDVKWQKWRFLPDMTSIKTDASTQNSVIFRHFTIQPIRN